MANIPYYITGAIIRKFLSTNCQPSLMVLMVQKEVGRRIIAQDKKESILSLSVKAYGTPHYVATVNKESFNPRPKVDSAILSIKNISKSFFVGFSEETFFEIVKKAFGSKRKIVRNNLLPLLGEKTNDLLLKANIAPNTRPEDITLSQWKILSACASSKHNS